MMMMMMMMMMMILDQTPKVLRKIKENWAPDAFLVTFKLETDKNLLWKKMKAAYDTIHMDMIVGNILASAKNSVIVWTCPSSTKKLKISSSTTSFSSQISLPKSDVVSLDQSNNHNHNNREIDDQKLDAADLVNVDATVRIHTDDDKIIDDADNYSAAQMPIVEPRLIKLIVEKHLKYRKGII